MRGISIRYVFINKNANILQYSFLVIYKNEFSIFIEFYRIAIFICFFSLFYPTCHDRTQQNSIDFDQAFPKNQSCDPADDPSCDYGKNKSQWTVPHVGYAIKIEIGLIFLHSVNKKSLKLRQSY